MNKGEAREFLKALALMGVETIVLAIVLRMVTRPDFRREQTMRLFRGVENVCESNARAWAMAADVSHKLYKSSASVV